MVDVEERPGTPRGGLVERAKSEWKLTDAVRLDHFLQKKV